jgi:hypothetical protein
MIDNYEEIGTAVKHWKNIHTCGIQCGSSTTPRTDSTAGGSVMKLYMNPTDLTGASGEYFTARIETAMPVGTFAGTAFGAYSGRFLVGLASGTLKGTSGKYAYITGVQGKLTGLASSVLGDGTSGGIINAAVLGQLNYASGATFGADAEVYALWADNQSGAALPATSTLLRLSNNGAAITNMILGYGNNAITDFMNLSAMGTAVVSCTGVTTANGGKCLKIVIDSVTYYIPCCTGTS